MDFINRIESLLKTKKISKTAFLEELGLNKNTFSAWRKRNTIPSTEVMLKIANRLEVPMDYLMTGEPAIEMPDKLTTIYIIEDLLEMGNKTAYKMCEDLKIDSSTYSKWRAGTQPSKKYLKMVADYLGVNENYLLDLPGGKILSEKEGNKKLNTDDDLIFALWGEHSEDIGEDELLEVRNFAQFIAERKRKKNGKNYEKLE